MNMRGLSLVIGAVLLPLGCGDNDDSIGPAEPLVLDPGESCSGLPDTTIATFEDANLEAAIRAALSVGAEEDLTCSLVSGLTELDASGLGIASLMGVQNLTNLTGLYLYSNSISDISALSGLTNLIDLVLNGNSMSLTRLCLSYNSITDITALSGLTSLTELHLYNNPDLTDIQPLLDNTGLGDGDTVDLESTGVSCTDVAALEAKGVTVYSDCPRTSRAGRGLVLNASSVPRQ